MQDERRHGWVIRDGRPAFRPLKRGEYPTVEVEPSDIPIHRRCLIVERTVGEIPKPKPPKPKRPYYPPHETRGLIDPWKRR